MRVPGGGKFHLALGTISSRATVPTFRDIFNTLVTINLIGKIPPSSESLNISTKNTSR